MLAGSVWAGCCAVSGRVKIWRCWRSGLNRDTSSPLGELVSSLRELIGYHRKQKSCGTAGTNGFPPEAVGRSARKRIDPSRVARESGIGAADTNARGIRCLSGAHPVSARCFRVRSAVRFAAAGTEPFRSGKRVRARITARQAPFRQERGTPGGCASLRGVDRPRPAPVKAPSAMFGMSLSAPAGANFSRRQCESREELISIRPT